MARRQHLDDLLSKWPYEPQTINVRVVKGKDGRDVIQMRVDLGILQLETEGRPDGTFPEEHESYFDYLLSFAMNQGDDFQLSEEQCGEVDREFVQFYHRRVCWLALREFRRAILDADHTLGLMDFCKKHSSDEQWTMSHEQYRPYVLFHRTQAAALAELDEENGGPESAVQAINLGLDRMRLFFAENQADEFFDEDELVARLRELQTALRDHYSIGRTLNEQLADAIAAEQYELAAKLRDELAKRNGDGR